MKFKRFVVFAGILAGLFLSAGCALTPKTAALQHVHDVYRDDFALLADSTNPQAAASAASSATFVRSLSAIHDYRATYPQETETIEHLKVLEGMIYLQSGRFGLAAAVKDDVVAAGKKLRSARIEGVPIRDGLFADNFEDLLKGWIAVRDHNASPEMFLSAADSLHDKLMSLPVTQGTEVRDDGALYLATSAAIFYSWACQRDRMSNFNAGPAGKAALDERVKKRFEKAHALIGKFLTEPEKTANIDKDVSEVAQGRLRYLKWYRYFDPAKIEEAFR